MANTHEVGSIVEGKVVSIQPFGAFVAIDDETEGLVHISEIANQFVKNIQDFVKVGDMVKVKILSIDENKNRISLSIKATLPKQETKKPSRPRPKQINKKKATPSNDDEGFLLLKDKLKDLL